MLNSNGALNSDDALANYVRVNPDQEYKIDEQGFIYQNDQVIDRIGVVRFADNNYVSKYGENLYNLVPGGQVLSSDASVEQGCLEASNVNVIDEMVDMITVARAYEAGQKVIQTEDSTLDKAVNSVGQV